MSQLITETRNKLGKMASPDEFEALATSVLREAEPAYASIIHVGTNSDGRAVRSPVDGITIYRAEGNRRLLMAQHTITARKGLRAKWLGKTTGDVIKAKGILAHELDRSAVEGATLVLACSCEPSEDLIRDVHAAAGPALFALVDDQRRAFKLDVVANPLEAVEERTLEIEPVLDEVAIGRAIGPGPLHLLDKIIDHRADHCSLKISGGDDLVKQVAGQGHDNLRMEWG